jgi:hypothetical protein
MEKLRGDNLEGAKRGVRNLLCYDDSTVLSPCDAAGFNVHRRSSRTNYCRHEQRLLRIMLTSSESDIRAEEPSRNPGFSFVILRSRHSHEKLIERVQ